MGNDRFYRNNHSKASRALWHIEEAAKEVQEVALSGDCPDESIEVKEAMNHLSEAISQLQNWVAGLAVMAEAEAEAHRRR